MCMATTAVSTIGLIGSVLGSVSSVTGQIQANKTAQAQANYTNAINQRDAELAEINARDAIDQGIKDQEEARREYKAKVGQLKTQYGAGNVTLDSGSTMDMLVDTAEVGELEALDIGANAQREADAYLRQAQDLRNEGSMALSLADQQSNELSTATSLLNGASSVLTSGTNYYNNVQNANNNTQSTSNFSSIANDVKKRSSSYF